MAVYAWKRYTIKQVEKVVRGEHREVQYASYEYMPRAYERYIHYEGTGKYVGYLELAGSSIDLTAPREKCDYVPDKYKYTGRTYDVEEILRQCTVGEWPDQSGRYDLKLELAKLEIKKCDDKDQYLEEVRSKNINTFPRSGKLGNYWYEFIGKIADTKLKEIGEYDIMRTNIKIGGGAINMLLLKLNCKGNYTTYSPLIKGAR